MFYCSSCFHHSSQGWPCSETEPGVNQLKLTPQSHLPSLYVPELVHCRVRYPQNQKGRDERRGSRDISFASSKTGIATAPKHSPAGGMLRHTHEYQHFCPLSIQPLQNSLQSFNTSRKFPTWSSFQHTVLCYQPYCWRSLCVIPVSQTHLEDLLLLLLLFLYFYANSEAKEKGTIPSPKTPSVLQNKTLKTSSRKKHEGGRMRKRVLPSLLTLPLSPIQKQLPHLINWDPNKTNSN